MCLAIIPEEVIVDFKIGERTMSKYDELKERIERLQNGWDKEADDILVELSKETKNLYWLLIPISDNGWMWLKYGDTREKNNSYVAKETYFYNQCEKMKQFKRHLLYILDHSNIKKDEKEEKRAELQKQIDDLQKQIEELR